MLLETESPSVIRSIKEVFKKEKKDFWEELTAEQKEEIELGERQIENGEFFYFEEIMKKYRT